jgi:hypothetical protein
VIRKHGQSIKEALALRAERKEKRARKARLIFSGKPKKRSRKAVVKEADAEFSKRIRERDLHIFGGCPLCISSGQWGPIEHCGHLITRAKYAVRWDPDNAIGKCASHNLIHEHNPHIFTNWYIGRFGLEQYQSLIARSNVLRKFTNQDLVALTQHYRLNSLIVPSGSNPTPAQESK